MVKAKVLKKEWHPIIAPKIFGNAVLGETYVYEAEQMVGKSITQNLMNLTNDVKRQNINVNFEVVNVQNGKAFTNVVGYHMAQSSVRRMVRRDIEKIDMSFLCKTSDNKNLQIKPLLITRSATTGSVAAKIRRNAQDFLEKYIGSISYDNLVNDLINHQIQTSLRKDLNKIYPLRVCEIRSMEIVDLEKKGQVKSKAKAGKKLQQKPAKKAKESEEAKKEDAQKSEILGSKASGTTNVVSVTHSMGKAKESKEPEEEKTEQEA